MVQCSVQCGSSSDSADMLETTRKAWEGSLGVGKHSKMMCIYLEIEYKVDRNILPTFQFCFGGLE